jgi:hypothetical protein
MPVMIECHCVVTSGRMMMVVTVGRLLLSDDVSAKRNSNLRQRKLFFLINIGTQAS